MESFFSCREPYNLSPRHTIDTESHVCHVRTPSPLGTLVIRDAIKQRARTRRPLWSVVGGRLLPRAIVVRPLSVATVDGCGSHGLVGSISSHCSSSVEAVPGICACHHTRYLYLVRVVKLQYIRVKYPASDWRARTWAFMQHPQFPGAL